MSTLTLVRHGQATPFEKVTDRLSEAGVRQAQLLGEYWRRHGVRFDEVVCGTLRRHQQTAEASGLLPDGIRFDPGWNEYRADEILSLLSPALEARREPYRRLAEASREGMHGPERNRHFQRMLEALMDVWLTGDLAVEGVESFVAFQARVQGALRTLLGGPSGRSVLVVTSGGPIGLCVQQALRAPLQTFLDVNWRMRNSSITEFTFSSTRFTLDTLNGLPHLEDRALWTWR